MYDYLMYIVSFAVAFAVSLYCTPYAKKLAKKIGAIDYPRSRGMHKEPIPRLGGFAIFSGFMAAMFILMPFIPEFRSTSFIGFIFGGFLIALLGLVDDIYQLPAKIKLLVQIIAALIVVFTGTTISVEFLPFYDLLKGFEIPITLIWIVGITNAVNFIDGLDGLAAGVTSIGAMCLVVLCLLSGGYIAVILAAGITGACFGFLPRNFNPAEIIMGDIGALFLGYALAVSSIIGVFKYYALLSVVLVVLALALPILDTAFAMIRRALSGKHIMTADRGHLHHRLIDAGMSPKQAVFSLYLLSAITGIISILIAIRDYRALLIVCVFIVLIGFMAFMYRRRLHR